MSVTRSIVYFGYLGDEGSDDSLVRQRLAFMEAQLSWLAELVALSEERIAVLVSYVAPRTWDSEVHRAIERHRFAIDPDAVRADRRNRFEYPGLRAMKAVAQESSADDLIYYCHSKGIMQLAASKMGLFRLHTEIGLTADLSRLSGDPLLTRAGLFPSRWGWCWYNFFWVKARHMAELTVEESTDRYHFEALIGDYADKEGYRGVLPLIDRLPFEDSGITPQPWYRPSETSSPVLDATYRRYGEMTSLADSLNAMRAMRR